jgi:hypothetical protein
MRCLICGGPATDISPGGFDGLVIDCPKCKPYEVAGSIQSKLGQLDQLERASVLRKAQRFAAHGARPTISSTSF